MIRICKSLTRAALPENFIQTSTCSANTKKQEETGERTDLQQQNLHKKKTGGRNFLNGDALVAVELSNLWNDGAVHRGCACDPVRSIWASHHHLLQSQTKQSCISTMASTYEFPENTSQTRRVTTNTIATTSHWLLFLFVTKGVSTNSLRRLSQKKYRREIFAEICTAWTSSTSAGWHGLH